MSVSRLCAFGNFALRQKFMVTSHAKCLYRCSTDIYRRGFASQILPPTYCPSVGGGFNFTNVSVKPHFILFSGLLDKSHVSLQIRNKMTKVNTTRYLREKSGSLDTPPRRMFRLHRKKMKGSGSRNVRLQRLTVRRHRAMTRAMEIQSSTLSDVGLKSFRARTPGLRSRKVTIRKNLWRGSPFKPLTIGLRKLGGRCRSTGRITVWHRGGGHKRLYRKIDFVRRDSSVWSNSGVVERVEYDPNRSGRIALISYDANTARKIALQGIIGSRSEKDRDDAVKDLISIVGRRQVSIPHGKQYILATHGLQTGDIISNGRIDQLRNGSSAELADFPLGSKISSVEIRPGSGGCMARSAGTYCILIRKDVESDKATLRLPSGETRTVSMRCCATLGIVSNIDHNKINLGKAGAKRWLGKRSVVRGVAMNPIDHPHGGGEGKTSGGRPAVSPWGKLTDSGVRTRNWKKKSSVHIISSARAFRRARSRRNYQPGK